MNKVILLLIAICMFTSVNAQEVKKVAGFNVAFGAKAGLNFATVFGDTSDPSLLVGVHFGGTAEAYNKQAICCTARSIVFYARIFL